MTSPSDSFGSEKDLGNDGIDSDQHVELHLHGDLPEVVPASTSTLGRVASQKSNVTETSVLKDQWMRSHKQCQDLKHEIERKISVSSRDADASVVKLRKAMVKEMETYLTWIRSYVTSNHATDLDSEDVQILNPNEANEDSINRGRLRNDVTTETSKSS